MDDYKKEVDTLRTDSIDNQDFIAAENIYQKNVNNMDSHYDMSI